MPLIRQNLTGGSCLPGASSSAIIRIRKMEITTMEAGSFKTSQAFGSCEKKEFIILVFWCTKIGAARKNFESQPSAINSLRPNHHPIKPISNVVSHAFKIPCSSFERLFYCKWEVTKKSNAK